MKLGYNFVQCNAAYTKSKKDINLAANILLEK